MTRLSRPPSLAVRNRPPLRHRIHRVLGVSTGVMLFYLVGTGLPLQFTQPLDLAGRYVDSPVILDWYGIQTATTGTVSHRAVQIGGSLFWDSDLIAETTELQGALDLNGLAVVASGNTALVFPEAQPTQKEVIVLHDRIQRIGRKEDQLVLELPGELLTLDTELLNLRPADDTPGQVQWMPLTTLNGESLTRFGELARSRILSLERLLQDLHSGRTFGWPGEWLINLATLALVVLAFTGLTIWWKTR